MPRCTICLQHRPSLKFRTGRLSICSHCVSSLNQTKLSKRAADLLLRQQLRDGRVRRDAGAVEWIDGWLDRNWERVKAKRMRDPERVRKSHALKVLRAYERGLICLDRRYLDYPSNWPYRRFLILHLDNYACRVCGARREDGAELHVHHIVFRSNSGTNHRRNLVSLCRDHHQAQHDHPISCRGGEGAGLDRDTNHDAVAEARAYATLMPRFHAALHYLRSARGTSTRYEFFRLLLQLHGLEIGPLALRFAQEERLREDLSTVEAPVPDDSGSTQGDLRRARAAV